MSFWGRKKHSLSNVVKPHLGRLYQLAYRLTGNPVDAEDLVQELMLKLAERDYGLETIEHPAAWLNKVLYRLYLDHVRSQQKNPLYLVDDSQEADDSELLEQIEDTALTPEGYFDQECFFRNFETAIHKLPNQQRILILLRDVEGYSMEEIQALQDIPMGTLKSRLHRAREKLMFFLTNNGT